MFEARGSIKRTFISLSFIGTVIITYSFKTGALRPHDGELQPIRLQHYNSVPLIDLLLKIFNVAYKVEVMLG